MRKYEVKSFGELEPLDMSDDGFVKVAFNRANIKDSDGDILTPSAFTKSIKERGSLIYHLTDHVWKWSESFIGKPETFMEGDLLVGSTKIDLKSNPHGAFMHARYMKGEVNQHSIGGYTIKQNKKSDYNEITEFMLLEGSAVLWGANSETPTLMAKSFNSKNEFLEEFENLYSDFKRYLKGGLSVDDTYFFGKTLEQYYTKIQAFDIEKTSKSLQFTTADSTITDAENRDSLSQFLFK